MPLSRPLRKVASKVLGKLGTPAVITRTVSTVNPVAGTTSDVETTYAVKCAVSAYADGLVDGEAFKASDRRIVIAAQGIAISPTEVATADNVTTTDRIAVNGEGTFQVHRVKRHMADTQVVAWEIQGRR